MSKTPHKTKHWYFPSCNKTDQQPIIDVINKMRGDNKEHALDLLDNLGPKTLCQVLHGIRRWYSSQNGNVAWKVIPHRTALMEAMDLRPEAVLGVYRGFKVFNDDKLADCEPGDIVTIPVTRNGSCTSWTTHEKIAHRFSGASKERTGLVVTLADTKGVKPFIAPPEFSEPWFNKIYRETMGKSFRHKEGEFVVYAKKITVEVLRVKRR